MSYKRILIGLLTALSVFVSISCERDNNKGRVRILILSGQNNHDWNKTTPLLSDIYARTSIYTVSITESPDTLSYKSFKKFDVIVSNWNTWPDNDARLSPEWEDGFLRFVSEGGGAVFIHAGASSFYSWDDYHKIGTGRWGKETSHGKPRKGKICELSQDHPVTAGIKDFFITDELWRKTEIHPDARVLASVSWTDEVTGKQFTEKAVLINQYGKGRCFYTILGHDARAMLNSGFQTLLLRGTSWTAKRETDPGIPYEIKINDKNTGSKLVINRTDTTISLIKGQQIIWQLNYNNRYGKHYFHPVSAGNSILTCESPPDHPWHMGLWFSWKFINGINYWEYLDDYSSEETGYRSAGITQIRSVKFKADKESSADILLDILYQPSRGKAVMTEKCSLHISPPSANGSYFIDFDHTFTPVSGEAVLDRTPVSGEPDGKSWGGYSGLSVRFNQDYTSASVAAPDTANNYRKNAWVYMGFKTLAGNDAGICIFTHPEYTTESTSWYIINDPSIPFYYYSPAAIYDGKLILRKEDILRLRYRVWVLPGKVNVQELNEKYNEYLAQEKL